jgi:hypothetical protein
MTERCFNLEITETQAEVLIRATDLLSRIQGGQFKVMADEFIGADFPVEYLHAAQHLLGQVHTLLTGLPTNAYHGIHSPELPDTARIAYDLHQVIRHRIEHDKRPDCRWNVWRNPPMKPSHGQELARIVEVELA